MPANIPCPHQVAGLCSFCGAGGSSGRAQATVPVCFGIRAPTPSLTTAFDSDHWTGVSVVGPMETIRLENKWPRLSWNPCWWGKHDTSSLQRSTGCSWRQNWRGKPAGLVTVWSHIYTFQASHVTWLVQDSLHLIPGAGEENVQNASPRRWCSSSFWPGYTVLLQRSSFLFHFTWLLYAFLPTRVKCYPLVLPRFSSLYVHSVLSGNEGDISLVMWHLWSMNCLMFYNAHLQSAVHAH